MSACAGGLRCALAVALILALGAAGPADEGETLGLEVTPFDLGQGVLTGVSLEGAWRLDTPHPAFGGISGLLVEGKDVTAVTDQGWWIEGRRDGLTLEGEIRMAPMTGALGRAYGKSAGDAESLTRRDGRLVVGFERDHRLAAHVGKARIGRDLRDPGFEAMASNGGLEGLATLPDGRLLALSEEPAGDGFRMFVHVAGGEIEEGRLAIPGRHSVTGADIGPDRRLYVVMRHFSLFTGVSIRVVRFALGSDGLPEGTAETLAVWETTSGIDNMEGIAAFRAENDGDEDGPLILWLISDDNFNAVQRTILVALKVE